MEAIVPTPLPTIDYLSGIGTTVDTISKGGQNFITSAWPELLTLILFIFFVLLAWRLGSRALGRLRGLGR